MKRKTRRIWAGIFFTVFILSAAATVYLALDYKKSQDIYADSRAFFSLTEQMEIPSELGAEPTVKPVMHVDFEAIQEINPEVVGWLWIPDTDISYPLVQGEDNDYYLNTSYDLQQSVNGSIFVDYRNQDAFRETNTIIYGHNMNNGTMFGRLSKFLDQTYAEEHQLIYVLTPKTQYVFQLYSAYVGRYNGPAYITGDELTDDEMHQRFLDQLSEDSQIDLGIEAGLNDNLLTLSTCTSISYLRRTVVHAVLVEQQLLLSY